MLMLCHYSISWVKFEELTKNLISNVGLNMNNHFSKTNNLLIFPFEV